MTSYSLLLFLEEMHQYMLSKIGERVKEFRKANGWTLDELGKKSGLHPSSISQIERGERNITLLNLAQLANGLEVEVYQLLMFPDRVFEGVTEMDTERLEELLEKAPEEKKEMMHGVARTVLEWRPESD